MNRRVLVVPLLLAACALVPRPAAAGLTSDVIVNGARVSETIAKPFTLTRGKRTWTVPASTVKTWVKTRTNGDTTFLQLRPNATYAYLNQKISPAVNDTGDNARFVFKNGVPDMKAPGAKGSIVDGVKTSLAIRDAIVAGKSSAAVSMKPYDPPILTLGAFKKLGISDHIGRGESNFAGSPANRIKNINVGRLRFQGLLIAPGGEFSFDKVLGPVTAEAGFVPELVIKENVTTPEFGGGLCQVSTTAFRAGVKTGLDVTARRQHAYPVRYYGTPGFDATIYPPSPDLRFVNTTGNWILIQTSVEGTKLIFDVYGKSDGRTVAVDGPHTIEKRPDGSIRTLLRQVVKDKNGNVIHNELFPSTYKSPDLFPTVRENNGEL